MALYVVTGHWDDGDDVIDRVHSVAQVVGIINTCLGDGCTGFTIEKKEEEPSE